MNSFPHAVYRMTPTHGGNATPPLSSASRGHHFRHSWQVGPRHSWRLDWAWRVSFHGGPLVWREASAHSTSGTSCSSGLPWQLASPRASQARDPFMTQSGESRHTVSGTGILSSGRPVPCPGGAEGACAAVPGPAPPDPKGPGLQGSVRGGTAMSHASSELARV